VPPSALDADHRRESRNLYGKPRRLGRFNDRTDILVGSRRFLRDAALRGAFHKDTALLQLIDDLAPAPILERLMAAYLPARAMASGGK